MTNSNLSQTVRNQLRYSRDAFESRMSRIIAEGVLRPIAAIEANAQHDVVLYMQELDMEESEVFSTEWTSYVDDVVPTPRQAIEELLSDVPQGHTKQMRALHGRLTAWVRANFAAKEANFLCGVANRYLPLRGIPEFEEWLSEAQAGERKGIAVRIITTISKSCYTDQQRLEIGKWLERKIALFLGSRQDARLEMVKMIPNWEEWSSNQEALAKQTESAEPTQPATKLQAVPACEPTEPHASSEETYAPSEEEIATFLVEFCTQNKDVEFEEGGMREFAIQQLMAKRQQAA